MRVKNNDELQLAGSDLEVITVAITNSTNSPLFTYTLNGKTWAGGSFTLDRAIAPIFKLLVQTTYKTDSGGSAEFTLTGSGGGDTSVHDEIQSPGEAFDAAMYTITIL